MNATVILDTNGIIIAVGFMAGMFGGVVLTLMFQIAKRDR